MAVPSIQFIGNIRQVALAGTGGAMCNAADEDAPLRKRFIDMESLLEMSFTAPGAAMKSIHRGA
jgi:DNA-binding protein